MDSTIVVSIMMGVVALGLITVLIISLILGYKLIRLHLQHKDTVSNKAPPKEPVSEYKQKNDI